ncbi:hypothetical protein MAPG_05966 [Magnaporthiopsis poae ATCC 64411]|uniref:Uncharacterized protein n=1 Tax=Magnaporthiopsis poae (strain ATCC 64411 / 73-15) TaxID=644358 RepID=A0A0C4E0T2_MAGP6|nr:hypothetical protein MAPG_05966 [Magnaporthiopsis poae ATCC 64411]
MSMSVVISEDTQEMKDQIRAAADAGIVMTCTVHDEGSRITEAYPIHRKGQTSGNLLVLAATSKKTTTTTGTAGTRCTPAPFP